MRYFCDRGCEAMSGGTELPTTIDLALNEASWFDAVVDRDRRQIALAFDVLALPDGSNDSGCERVSVVLVDVHRCVASHRRGRWDDASAEVLPCGQAELPDVVRAFGGSAVYGWEFFDTPEEHWRRWSKRLSFDEQWAPGSGAHSLDLFKEGQVEGADQHLDFRAWFDRLEVYSEDGRAIDLEDFAAAGKRWWDAMYAGDKRTAGAGIFPLKSQQVDSAERPAVSRAKLRWWRRNTDTHAQ
jgi:hypothetical protein